MTAIEPAQQAAAAQQAFAAERRIRDTIHIVRTAWVKLAGELFEFQTKDMHKDLGYVTFEEWLASPDIDLSRRWVYQLIDIWRELVVKKRVAPARLEMLEPSKLQDVLPAVRRGNVEIDEALSDAQTLARGDLRERYGSQGAGTITSKGAAAAPDTGTAYDAEREPAMVICPACSSRVPEERLRG